MEKCLTRLAWSGYAPDVFTQYLHYVKQLLPLVFWCSEPCTDQFAIFSLAGLHSVQSLCGIKKLIVHFSTQKALSAAFHARCC